MVHVKVSQLIAAAAISAAGLVGFGGIAAASSTAGTSTGVACVNGDGEMQFAIDSPAADAGTTIGTSVPCDPTSCSEGVLTTVVDDSGVEHLACVESAADAPVAAPPAVPATIPARASLAPRTANTTAGLTQLPKTGAGTGGLVIAALLVVSGSVASLLSRRKL
jgi:LPXTG-motif cell wall-anchored protein